MESTSETTATTATTATTTSTAEAVTTTTPNNYFKPTIDYFLHFLFMWRGECAVR